jgi:hypothetical protein
LWRYGCRDCGQRLWSGMGLDGQGSRREGRTAVCGSGEQQRAERVERRRVAAASSSFFFFFFVYSLSSYATYLDHDEHYVQSVSQPQTARSGTVQASLCPPPRPIPVKVQAHQGNYKGKEQRKDITAPYSASTDAMKGGVGRNSGSSPTPSASASAPRSSSRS